MAYISTVEFQSIALACDAVYRDLRGVHIVDNGNGVVISTDTGNVKIVRYAGGCPFTFQAYVEQKLEGLPVMLQGVGKHHEGVPVFDVMADAWLDGLLNGSPVRTPLERESGVIYG